MGVRVSWPYPIDPITGDDVCETGACPDGVRDWAEEHLNGLWSVRVRTALRLADDEESGYIKRAARLDGYGCGYGCDGDGYGGYGYGGYGGDGYSYGYGGCGYGGYGDGGGDGDGYGYGGYGYGGCDGDGRGGYGHGGYGHDGEE